MNRRRFLSLLAAAPVAAIAAPTLKFSNGSAIAFGDGLQALVNDGTIAPTYAGLSRDDEFACYFRVKERRWVEHPERMFRIDGLSR